MEAAHRVEIGGERIAVSCLQLLDEALHVGGNDFFRGLPWLRLFGVSLMGVMLLVVVFMVFPPWPWPLLFMPCVACTYMPNASWRRRG